IAVTVQQLEAVAPLREKHKQIPRKWILAQMCLHQACQRVEALAHVGGQRAQKDPAGQRQVQHGGSSNRRSSWRSSSASKPGCTRSRRCCTTTTSMAEGSAGLAATDNFRNVGSVLPLADCAVSAAASAP